MTDEKLCTRIRVDADTGCWIWIGNISKQSRQPQLRVNGKGVSGRKHVADRFLEEPVPAGHFTAPACGNRFCVNPFGHVVVVATRGEYTRLAAARGVVFISAETRRKISATKRARSKILDPVKVEQLRTGTETIYEAGARLGICPTHVAAIRRDEAWSRKLDTERDRLARQAVVLWREVISRRSVLEQLVASQVAVAEKRAARRSA